MMTQALDDPFAQVALAAAIAREAHAGQVDKLGVEYVRHPQAVASAFDPETQPVECAGAWLHDVLEDTDIDADDLRSRGVQEPVLSVVDLLTRRDDVPDDTYYRRIAAHPVARAVKIADIAHNLHPDRVAALEPDVRERLARKYDTALRALGVRGLEPAP
ncbi:HD domain-containing protein [Cellulomonas sp. URHD0024]|uniref:HD domain-containing protein n=1 Tax=Cellulomonas sp. URHD0024 TaxID=1302620 RepID=UPI0004263C0F|nr:HD domain-containing protein [Cellulomonas sp. URHD0024]